MKVFSLALSAAIAMQATAKLSTPARMNEGAVEAPAAPLSSFRTPNEESKVDRVLESKTGKTTKADKDSCAHRIADQVGWSNWYKSVETFAPVFRVKNDKELRDIIKTSKKEHCIVRPFGATHTYDGFVMQRTEKDVVLISLADHTPDDSDWAPSADATTGKVKLLAGQSWYDAVVLYRHHGLVMPDRTLSRFFSVGGVIANPVHGGARDGGFVHSYVTKMLVMTSDGKTSEIKGDELKYWRSSGGQLGIILAVEMQLIKEVDKGGTLAMKHEVNNFSSVFANPGSPTMVEVSNLVGLVAQKVYSIIAAYDHNSFIFDYYTNQLASYFTDFSGPKFDATLSAKYAAAAQYNLLAFGQDVAFTGGTSIKVPKDLCTFLCMPGTGNPPTGNGTIPCDPARMPVSGELVCKNPLATAAAFVQTSFTTLKDSYEATAASVNDGYLTHFVADHTYVSVIIPSRAFSRIFATWWGVHSRAIQLFFDPNAPFHYIPNNVLEFRFINPVETAVMNPIQPFSQVRADFDNKYFNSFDNFYPPIQGVPDGLISMEWLNIKGANDNDHPKYFTFLEQALHNVPSNPLAQYGNNSVPSYGPIVPACDAGNNIVLCASVNQDNNPPFANPINNMLPCCNPPVPVTVHITKEYGFGVDPETTPTTGQPVPFHNQDIVNAVFAAPKKAASIVDFNAKVKQYDADVFKGGALLRWLSPAVSKGFEPRSLTGQTCGSEEYKTNRNAECISNKCNLSANVCS